MPQPGPYPLSTLDFPFRLGWLPTLWPFMPNPPHSESQPLRVYSVRLSTNDRGICRGVAGGWGPAPTEVMGAHTYVCPPPTFWHTIKVTTCVPVRNVHCWECGGYIWHSMLHVHSLNSIKRSLGLRYLNTDMLLMYVTSRQGDFSFNFLLIMTFESISIKPLNFYASFLHCQPVPLC